MSETWRPVVGWEGLYEVSDLGSVRSLARWVVDLRGQAGMRGGRTLSQGTRRNGYRHVALCPGNQSRTVHTLVMEAFVGPRPPGAQVRHLNGDPADNRVSNLAYGTPRENAADTKRHGRAKAPPLVAKLDEAAVRCIRESSEPSRVLAGRFGVAPSTVRNVRQRQTWRDLP